MESDNLGARLANLSPTKRALLELKLKEKSLKSAFTPGIPRRSTRDTAPLSFAQQRLWFLNQLEPESPVYNESNAVRLSGILDIDAFKRALNQIVLRHEVIRTTIVTVDGSPCQVVSTNRDIDLPVIDLRAVPKTDRDSEAQRLIVETIRKTFDLSRDLMLRVLLLQLAEKEHIFLVVKHHIASDGWSSGVFWKELTALYEAFVSGEPSPLPELPIQYADYAVWQREWLQGEVLERQLSYWKKQLAGLGTLQMPKGRPHPAVQSYRGKRHTIELSKQLSQKLRALSRQQGATLFMTLLAAFQTLLYRYTGQEDIAVGCPIAGRTRQELEGLIGFFVNTLVVRVNFSGNPTFRELLARVREVALGAYGHQDLPFEKLVEELQPERNLSQSPLFQVAFAYQNTPNHALEIPGVVVTPVEKSVETTKFDLHLSVNSVCEGVRATLYYATDLYDDVTIARLFGHLRVLLEGIVADPDRRVSELPILTETEEHQLLIDWNDTQRDYPKDKCIHELFEQQVEKRPDAVALVLPTASSGYGEDLKLTYQELNRKANQLAHYLQSLGVGSGTLVGICMERSLEMVIGLLGTLKAGGAYLPLDPSYPSERLAFMLADTQAPVLLTQRNLIDQLPEMSSDGRPATKDGRERSSVVGLRSIICLDTDWDVIAQESVENTINNTIADNLAYVIYTSGSTGIPKGVEVLHRGISRLLMGSEYALLDANHTFLHLAPTSFDASTFEIWAPLLHGAKCILFPGNFVSPGELGEVIHKHDISTLWLTASLFNAVVDQAPEALSGVRQLLIGGEVLSVPHVRKALSWLPETQIINCYGPTEGTTFTCCHSISRRLDASITSIPIGRPIANTEVYLLDSRLSPVPIGVAGELYIGGDGLARGYLNRPELISEKFISHPFSSKPRERLYKTGDLARYLPNGNIEFLGRTDHQVKIRGFRIELGEIEATMRAHPGVCEAVVVEHDNGGLAKNLVGYIVPSQDGAPTAGELRRFLKKKLPEYMVPSVFIFLDRLPLTPNGKIDRKALPAPDQSRPGLEELYVAPRTPVEEIIAEIWGEVLKVHRVGVHDNFFDLGGHSLLATQVMSRIGQVLKTELPLRALFEGPTVAELAERIEGTHDEEQRLLAPPIVAVLRDKDLPLSFAQERLWFLDQYEPNSSIYNLPSVVRLKGSLDIGALEWSLAEIQRRHESLRTTFAVVDGEAVQVIGPSAEVSLAVVDLRDNSEGEREEEARRLAKEESQRPFDLARGPLFRASLIRLGEEDQILVVAMHHIVSDGWSMGVLYRELSVLYRAFVEGEASPLSELPIQYADYAVWQREWLQGEVLDRQLSYWKKQLEGIPAVLDLPTDRPRPAEHSFRGKRQPLMLSKELSDGLKALSRKEGVTLFMTLLAAFQTLLYRYTGQDDLVIGSPIAGRNRSETESLIGFFVNTLVLRTDLSGNPTFRELIHRVRRTALGAYEHQDLPFEKLVEELNPERNLSHSPVFQVMFVLQNAPATNLSLEGLCLSPLRIAGETVKFDLTLSISESLDGLRGSLQYNTDLFDDATIVQMLGHLQVLLEDTITNPDERISHLRLLTEAESHQLLMDWNDTKKDYPREKCLHELFEEQVERSPDAAAVIFKDQQLTYRELNRKANQLARYLAKQGVESETSVGICVERSLEMIVGILGILKAGHAFVPLDPTFPKERLIFMLEDSQARVLLTQSSFRSRLPGVSNHGRPTALEQSPVVGLRSIVCLDTDWNVIAQENTENLISRTSPENIAYVMYTSGSTGGPKGVMVEHRSLVNYLYWVNESLLGDRAQVIPLTTQLTFDASLKQLFAPLLRGKEVWILPGKLMADPVALLTALGKQTRVGFNGVPSLWRAMLETIESGQAVLPTESLSTLFVGGEQLNKELVHKTLGAFPNLELWNLYGLTEVTANSIACRIASADSITIGRPIANGQVYILDRQLQPVPIHVPGELHIGGAGLARGYLNRSALTAEKFLPHPFSPDPGARLYKTGDLARYLSDGRIEFLGRIDQQVKIRGFRIELGEIEATLSQHSAVKEAVVVAREAAPGDKRLIAYAVLKSSRTLDATHARSFLKEKLPEYMVPSAFIFLDSFPLTPNGKVDRKGLPGFDQSRCELKESFVAPRTPVEELLANIWAEVLKLPKVGVHDNFFELGGHSLLATQLVSRLRERLLVELPLRVLFENATVASLSKHIETIQSITRQGTVKELSEEREEIRM